MPVDRRVFWAGVLLLVAWFPAEIFLGPMLSSPLGTSYDFSVPILIVALALLIGSAIIGGGATAASGRPETAPGPAESR